MNYASKFPDEAWSLLVIQKSVIIFTPLCTDIYEIECSVMPCNDCKGRSVLNYLHHENVPSLVEEHCGHDVRHGLLDDRLVVCRHARLHPFGHRGLVLIRQGKVAKVVQLFVGLGLQQRGQVGLNVAGGVTRSRRHDEGRGAVAAAVAAAVAVVVAAVAAHAGVGAAAAAAGFGLDDASRVVDR